MAAKTDPEELVEQIYGYGVAVIIALLMVYMIYAVLEALIGQLPATVAGLLVGVAGVYVVAVNRKIRKELQMWVFDE